MLYYPELLEHQEIEAGTIQQAYGVYLKPFILVKKWQVVHTCQ